MAQVFAVSPILRLKRSPQSGNYTMTVAWQAVFSQSQAYAWLFGSGRIDLTSMVAGDHIDIRVSSRNTATGGYIVQDFFDYDDAQPVNKQKIAIGTFVDTYGLLIEMRQTAGVARVINCEFFDAVR